ncbi:MAG: hypothetical protein CG442_1115 [Methylococcaceae bacterium NSO1]|jgi:chromatin segregation and condensation protein Rec8/ScpA/Scc1 (kleisin family)|nr:MAG: hypothetical protein CG442_1115 [Methylococcaceae bacterium NSO1]
MNFTRQLLVSENTPEYKAKLEINGRFLVMLDMACIVKAKYLLQVAHKRT